MLAPKYHRSRPFKKKQLIQHIAIAITATLPAMAGAAEAPFSQTSTYSMVMNQIKNTGVTPNLVDKSKQDGYATFMNFASQTPLSTPSFNKTKSNQDAESRARTFLNAFQGAFADPSMPQELTAVKVVEKDEVGFSHVRFQQIIDGVPVTSGEIVIHLNDDGVTAVNSTLLTEKKQSDKVPTIQTGYALKLARDLVRELFPTTYVRINRPKKVWFNEAIFSQAHKTGKTKLAWEMEAKGIKIREKIWIDAHTGAVLHHFSQITEGKKRYTYDANNRQTQSGTLKRSEGTGNIGESNVDNAHNYAGDTYDYFSTHHNRDSYDNRGASIISIVNYGQDYGNAFWDGRQMTYGEGFANADDVVGHELSHAVTEHTAGLIYENQSGALNESFSDIFGESIDLLNSGGTDTASVRWQIGEDIPGFGAFRNLMNPQRHNNPAKTSDSLYYCGNEDNGGVHLNSGVPNHAFALMVDGGSYNSYNISGIGLTKAGKIQYRTLSKYLTQSSTFYDNYRALGQSCTDLIGTAGITSNDCIQVTNAAKAVEMNKSICGSTVPVEDDTGGGNDNTTVQVIGNIDSVASNSINGWSCLHQQNTPLNVYLFVGGPYGSGTYVGTYVANQSSEQAIKTACATTGNHRYSIPLSSSVLTQHQGKSIYVYGISGHSDISDAQLDQSGRYTIPSQGGGGTDTGDNTGGDSCASESLTNALPNGQSLQHQLRSFRDQDLKQSTSGQRMINLYYKHSPLLKELMQQDWQLRAMGLRLLLRATYALSPQQAENNIIPLDDNYTKLAKTYLTRANKLGNAAFKADYAEFMSIADQLKGLTTNELKTLIRKN